MSSHVAPTLLQLVALHQQSNPELTTDLDMRCGTLRMRRSGRVVMRAAVPAAAAAAARRDLSCFRSASRKGSRCLMLNSFLDAAHMLTQYLM